METEYIALHLDGITTIIRNNKTYLEILVCLQGNNINKSDWFSSKFSLEYICQTVLSKYYAVGTKCKVTIYSLDVRQDHELNIIITE